MNWMRRLCSLLTYSTAANRTLRVVTHQPTTLFKNWFPSSTFTYWGAQSIYILMQNKKKVILTWTLVKKKAMTTKYKFTRYCAHHMDSCWKTRPYERVILTFFGLLIKDLSDGHLPWLCTPCFTNCSSIISWGWSSRRGRSFFFWRVSGFSSLRVFPLLFGLNGQDCKINITKSILLSCYLRCLSVCRCDFAAITQYNFSTRII